MKKGVLKSFAKFTGKQLFFCEFCEIIKNTYIEEHLKNIRTAASVLLLQSHK